MNANDSPKPPRRFSRLFRWLRRVLAVAFLLIAVIGVYLAVRHLRAVNRLAEATAEMDAQHPGWRIEDIEAARANVPDEENGMLVVRETVRLLPQGWPPKDNEFPGPNDDVAPNRRLDPDKRNRLHIALEEWAPARSEARKLVAYSRGRGQLTYERNPLATLLPHVQDARNVMFLLTFDARVRIEEGDLREAALLCRAAINAGRSIGDEPFSISQLVRLTCVTVAGKTTERLMAQGEPTEEDLAALQGMFEEEALYPGLLLGYRVERAMVHRVFEILADGEFVHDLALERLRKPTWSEYYLSFPERDSLRIQHVEAFPLLNKLVEVGETPTHLRARPLQEWRAMIAAQRMNYAAPLTASLDKLEAAFTRRDCNLNCLATALAVERYRRQHHDWPPSLEALAPKFLAAPPLDAFDAQPLRYCRLNDGLVIYSLCPDGKGQIYDPKAPSLPGEGIAVRLWDVRERKQVK